LPKGESKIMLSTKVEVKNIPQEEKGLFALEEIKKGEVVWKLDPSEKILTESERDNLPKEIRKLAFQYKNGFVVVHDKSEYMNHSCNPNLGFSSDEEMSAMRDVKVGEELTYDYSTADVVSSTPFIAHFF
jgi:uncharacterized protein